MKTHPNLGYNMTATADFDTITKEKTKVATKPPTYYRVIYLNDEITSVEFVVETLVSIFDYKPEDAQALALKIHTDGQAIVAVLPYEIAEQKGVEVTVLARSNHYPLEVCLEPTD